MSHNNILAVCFSVRLQGSEGVLWDCGVGNNSISTLWQNKRTTASTSSGQQGDLWHMKHFELSLQAEDAMRVECCRSA